jgi:predicted AlkP superfamily phosphohydrolase/phosphomutase
MSLFQRKARPLKRDDASLRDDRFYIVACDDTYAPKQYFEFFKIPRVQVHVIPTVDGTSAARHVLERLLQFEHEGEVFKQQGKGARRHQLCAGVCGVLLLGSSAAEAYVGPGAGIAFFSAFFLVFAGALLAVIALLFWPVRWLVRGARRGWRNSRGDRRVERVVIVGLDGMDPELVEKFMAEGRLPNLAALGEQGCFRRLQTSLPAESPVAWSSFLTGCNPGKHRIYDFLVPNRKRLRPELAAGHVETSRRTLKLGRYRIPLGRPTLAGGRRSRPFWELLGEQGLFSSVLRVPLSFPPEKFNGVLLSGMCLPDLRGSQGTYFYFTSDPDEERDLKNGLSLKLEREGETAHGAILGPENPLVAGAGEMEVPFVVQRVERGMELEVEGRRYPLEVGGWTPWVRLAFRPGLGFRMRGLCRFLLLEAEPHFRLYATPLQIDPAHPALPISHPTLYSVYLARKQDAFATLGVAEDLSALNEGVIGEDAFLEQCRAIQAEREEMFFDALAKTRKGLAVCVFDIVDRVQHGFWRFAEEGHLVNGEDGGQYRHVIRDVYEEMDALVGRVREQLDGNTALLVMSDHGFKGFRRQVDLNAWLRENGYLAVKEGGAGEDMLEAVDWERTRAYAVGFGGIYLNVVGREARGIVAEDEMAGLKRELVAGLLELCDGEEGERPLVRVYDREEVYRGPYVEEAPDLIAGFRPGYRVAWRTVTGGVGEEIFADNERPWSGDHNFDPAHVPGVLFCDHPLREEESRIIDVAPTTLELLGVEVPAYMDGVSLMTAEEG